ncbi:MAG: LegC family aminotransferase [Gammaproteobacteria bacterium]
MRESNNFELVTAVVSAIRHVVGDGPCALHEPSFKGNELRYVKDCLDSTFVSSVGEYVGQFELALRNIVGCRSVVAVASGTAALHLALKLSGIQPGQEVLLPALSFIATANAVSYCGGIPHFVDSEESTLGIDPEKLRTYLTDNTDFHKGECINRNTGRVIHALIPMHTFGHPADMAKLQSIAKEFDLILIEDAAEALGSKHNSEHVGCFGQSGILSFNGNKTITTGGGGAILTNNMELADRARHLSTTAKIPHRWSYVHDDIGYNYRMPNLNAALGCGQVEQLKDYIESKRRLFNSYNAQFSVLEGVSLFQEPENCESNYWLQTLILSPETEHLRDEILKDTNDSGIMTRPAWDLLNTLKPYLNCPASDLTVACSLQKRIINIPSSIMVS